MITKGEGEKVEGAVAPQRKWMVIVGLVAALATACSSSGSPRAALTEHDFAADPNLRLEPGQVGVTFLEPIDAADASVPDTGTVGVDVIPFLVSEAGTYTYALDPDDTSGTIARAEVSDAGSGFHIHGLLRATLTPSSPTATVTLDAGRYDLVIYSGYTSSQESGSHRTVFLRPPGRTATGVPTGSGRSRSADQREVKRLISTNACPGCDLYLAGLAHATLTGANLAGACLARADLDFAFLDSANLAGADLAWAYLSGATWNDGRVCALGSIGTCK